MALAGAQQNQSHSRPTSTPALPTRSSGSASADLMDTAVGPVQVKRGADTQPEMDRGRSPRGRPTTGHSADNEATLQRIKDDSAARALETDRLRALTSTNELARLTRAEAEARNLVQALRQELDLARSQHTVIVGNHMERIQSLVADLNTQVYNKGKADDMNRLCERRIEELEFKLNNATSQLTHFQIRIDALASERDEAIRVSATSGSAANINNQELKRQIVNLQASNMSFQTHPTKAGNDYQELQKRHDSHTRGYIQDVAAASSRIASLEGELEAMTLARQTLADDNMNIKAPTDLTDRDAVLKALRLEGDRLRGQLQSAEGRSQEDRARFDGERASFHARLSAAEETRLRMVSENSEVRTSNVTLSHEVDEVKGANVELKAANERHFVQYTRDQTDLVSLRHQMRHMHVEPANSAQVLHELSETRAGNKILEQKLIVMKSDLQYCNIERDRFKLMSERPVDAASNLTNNSERYRQQTAKFVGELNEAHAVAFAKVQEDLDFVTKQNEELQMEINAMTQESEVEEAPDEVDDFISELRASSGLGAQPLPSHPPIPSASATTPGAAKAKAKAKPRKANSDSEDDGDINYEDYDPDTLTTYTRKTREQDKITVPSFPGINQLINYRMELASALSTASGRYDCKEIGWFDEIMAPGKTFDDLADSGLQRFISLDIKLGAQLIPTIKAKNEARILYDEILLKQREANSKSTVLKGRQIVS